MNSLKTIVLIALTIILLSCNKNDDVPREPNVRLKAYTEQGNEYNLEYNQDEMLKSYQYNGRSDTKETATIIYDANGRIKENENNSYTYNDQGQLFKTKNISDFITDNTVQYNENGLISTFNVKIDGLNASSTTIEYDSNNRIKYINDHLILDLYGSYDDFKYAITTITYDDEDNIIGQNTEISRNGIDYLHQSTRSYSYDNKMNPNYNLISKIGVTNNINLIDIISSQHIGSVLSYDGLKYYNNHNLTSSKITYSTGRIMASNYEYSYDENNYPKEVKVENFDSLSGRTTYNEKAWTYESY